jgi:putative transposase
VSDRYAFIAAEEADPNSPYDTSKMCAWLRVSRSGFYDWCTRPPSATGRRREQLKTAISGIFERSRGTYGYRRVHAQLRRAGFEAGPELVRDLMRELGLAACQPRPYRITTVADPAAPAPADRLGRDFAAEAPGQKLVGDITYIATWEGWLYLATVIDCHSKKVIGWSMADHMRASLVIDALDMAAGNVVLAPNGVFHSDRGSTPLPATTTHWRATVCSRRWGARESAGTTRWPSRSSACSRTNSFTGLCSRPGGTPAMLLPSTSRCSTIGSA